jgi:hypothetical protein
MLLGQQREKENEMKRKGEEGGGMQMKRNEWIEERCKEERVVVWSS